ncbi:MAG: aminomethyl-transferring glycine dehydrogenase subunit GcvPA [Actinobacteria bacterium]|nr:aminomethyl-transferring glycine dehydrogenase subunit GcvPA [Actinomycetota bacterium]
MSHTIHNDNDRLQLLGALGASAVDDLFSAIPETLLLRRLDLDPGLPESETREKVEDLAAANRPSGPLSFLGAGCYRHYVPAAVSALTSRGEFLTAYTPYQPEASQGTLQSIFEFQTCVSELTGLEVANASLYDGPSALAEAAFMALRLTGRDELLVSAGVHPEALQVVETYAEGPELTVLRQALDPVSGTTSTKTLQLSTATGAVLVSQPNCLGVVEDLTPLAEAAHAVGALLVVSTDLATLGILESPGMLGADIAVGDAQVFGNAPSFGGPSVGFLACRMEHLRQVPGRLVGRTLDADGRPCYTLTLQAREQHIRRAKATSNICSNQALGALAATIHLALLGPVGLRELGEICLQRAHHLHGLLCEIPGVRPLVTGPFFLEFALALPCAAEAFAQAMRTQGIDPGVPLLRMERGARPVFDPDLSAGRDEPPPPPTVPAENVLLVAVTESNPPDALARYAAAAREVLAGTEPRPQGTR